MLALDLFCCGGGSTTGLQRAGFRVVGADHVRQKEYRGDDFLERDLSTAEAIRAVIDEVRPDFISSSPPCQAFSVVTPAANRHQHADLLPSTRAALVASGLPAWIENVSGAPLHHALRLCGSMFPGTQAIQRHRYFELIGWFTLEPAHDACTFLPDGRPRETTQVFGHGAPGRMYRKRVTVAGRGANGGNPLKCSPEKYAETLARNNAGPECINWRTAMGWLDGPRSRYCLAQAVPPAYAEWLARRFLETRRT